MFVSSIRINVLGTLVLGALALSGCAYYGGMEIAMTEKQSSGALEKGAITTLAIAPVELADREGKFGEVEATTLEAYNTLSQAVDAKPDGQKFKVLTPVQFNASTDSRMSDKEKSDALIAAGKKAAASHILVITSGKLVADSGTNAVLASQGLQKSQATSQVFIKVISLKTGTAIWQDNFDVTISYGMAVGISEAEVRKEIVKRSTAAFLNHYYSM